MPVTNTSAEKRKLIELLLQKKGLNRNNANVIPQAPAADYYPLSFAQRRLWFLDQLAPGIPLYNVPSAMRFRHRLDLKALEKAYSEIVSRHTSLRTTFSAREGEPVQVVAPASQQLLTVIDLSELPSAEREREAKRLAELEAMQPFDLSV